VIRGVDHVQLAAPPGSETEARRFFGGLLGLDELPKPASDPWGNRLEFVSAGARPGTPSR
jgi:hypothetical protein